MSLRKPFHQKYGNFRVYAFANSEGGYVLIGVDDNNHIAGVNPEDGAINPEITIERYVNQLIKEYKQTNCHDKKNHIIFAVDIVCPVVERAGAKNYALALAYRQDRYRRRSFPERRDARTFGQYD